MAHSYHKLWIHLIWSTQERRPLLAKDIRRDIFTHILTKARVEGIYVDTINGTADHVHCLLELDPKQGLAKIVNDLKGESSHWVNAQGLVKGRFAWQEGYSAFSYSESQVQRVREYIRDQEQHHKKVSFQEELERFLKAFRVGVGRP